MSVISPIYPTVIAFRQLCNRFYKRGAVKDIPVKSNLTLTRQLVFMRDTPLCKLTNTTVTLYPTLERSPLMREFKQEILSYFQQYLPNLTIEESSHAYI